MTDTDYIIRRDEGSDTVLIAGPGLHVALEPGQVTALGIAIAEFEER